MEAKDLAKLIHACRRAGVSELKVGDVSIKFGSGDSAILKEQKNEILVPSSDELRLESEKALITENVENAEEQLSNMQLEDPARFEQLLVERELEQSGGSSFN